MGFDDVGSILGAAVAQLDCVLINYFEKLVGRQEVVTQ